MSKEKFNREACIGLLQAKQKELTTQGLMRYPQRSDFSNEQVVGIKAFLGPWPRALEDAGLKEPKVNLPVENDLRIQVKRCRTEEKKRLLKEKKTGP